MSDPQDDNKPDLPRRGKFEVKPGRYHAKHEKGKERADTQRADRDAGRCQVVYVAQSNRRRADPRPDPQEPRVTGRYQDPPGHFVLQINQAGSHIECWLAEVLTAADRHEKQVYLFAGDLQDDGTFKLYKHPNPDEGLATLRTGDDDSITISGPEGTRRYVLNVRRPTLSENAIRALPEPREPVASFELTPFTRQYAKWLRSKLSEDKINGFLEAFFDVGGGTRVHEVVERQNKAEKLDFYIGDVFSTRPASDSQPYNGWHQQDIELARFHGREILASQRVVINDVQRSQLDWIDIVLSTVQRDAHSLTGRTQVLPNIREHLKLSAASDANPGQPKEKYDLKLMVGGLAGDVGIGLGGFTGALMVEKKTPPTWKQSFNIWFGGISAGLSAGVEMGFYSEGTAETHTGWMPADFPGWISMIDASGQAGLGVGGGGGGTAMIIHGSEVHAPMIADFTGWTVNSSIGGGVEIGGSWGRITGLGQGFEEKDSDHILRDEDYTVEAELETKVHFRLGDALLTDEGRQALRIMAAKELTCFSSEGSRLVLNGHADRVDCDERNVELSRLRAENAKQAVQDILGDQLGIPDDRIITQGLGERRAKAAGEPDEKANRTWRRVDTLLDSRLVLRLTGQ